MEEKKEIYQKVRQVIVGNHLSAADEDEMWKLLEERRKKQKGCLAAIIGNKLSEMAEDMEEGQRHMCQDIFEKCFQNTEIGGMDASMLPAKTVREYMESAGEVFKLDNDALVCFARMLQFGLDRLHDEGILKFTPDKDMGRKYLESKKIICYINNPYTAEETEKIMEWGAAHPVNARGLALCLWMTGGITLEEITELMVGDCWDGRRGGTGIKRCVRPLFRESRRIRIVESALSIHPYILGHIFTVQRPDRRGWEKMTAKGLIRELSYICKKTGVSYKKIYGNEAIRIQP